MRFNHPTLAAMPERSERPLTGDLDHPRRTPMRFGEMSAHPSESHESQHKRLARALVTLGILGNAAAQWLLVWLFARVSGPDGVGIYTTVLAIATPLSVAAGLGLRSIYLSLATDVAWSVYTRLRAGGIIAFILCATLTGLIVGIPTGILLATVLAKSADLGWDIHFARIQRPGHLLPLGILSLANPVFTVASAAIAVYLTASIPVGILASGITSLAVWVAAWRWSRLLVPSSTETRRAPIRGAFKIVLRAAAPTATTQTLYALSFSIPVLLLARFDGPDQVGIYSAAAYLVVLGNLLGNSLQTILLPKYYSTSKSNGLNFVFDSAEKTAFRLAAISLVGVAGIVAIGPRVLSLVYGPDFSIERLPLLLLALAAAITVPTYVVNSALLVANAYDERTYVELTVVVSTILIGVALVGNLSDLVLAATTLPLLGAMMRAGGSIAILQSRRSLRLSRFGAHREMD